MISPRLALAATVLTVAIAVPSVVATAAASAAPHHASHGTTTSAEKH